MIEHETPWDYRRETYENEHRVDCGTCDQFFLGSEAPDGWTQPNYEKLPDVWQCPDCTEAAEECQRITEDDGGVIWGPVSDEDY